MKTYSILVLLFIAVAGHAQQNETGFDPPATGFNDTSLVVLTTIDGGDQTYRVNFPSGATAVKFKGYLTGQDDKITYVMNVYEGQQLNAEIITDSTLSNARFSQIISPSGAADGPFGTTIIQYNLDESGDYQLIVAESLMAMEWQGSFVVYLEIKKRQ